MAYLSLGAGNSMAVGVPFSCRAHDRDNTSELANLLKRMERGEHFEREELPQTLVRTDEPDTGRCIISTGFFHLDARAAEVFRLHDLGEGFLWDITIIGRDGVPIDEAPPWFGLHVGAIKESLVLDASTGVRRAFGQLVLNKPQLSSGEAQLTVSPEAAKGADVWSERKINPSGAHFFISERLHRALEAAGLVEDFDVIACVSANSGVT